MNNNINTTINVSRKKLERYEKVKGTFKNAKKAISIVGGIATITLLICPLDGPFGEIASFLATGSLYIGVDAMEKIYDNVVDIPNKDTNVEDNINNIATNTKIAKEELMKLKNIAANIKKNKETGGKSL